MGVDPSRIGLKKLTISSTLSYTEILNQALTVQNLEKNSLVNVWGFQFEIQSPKQIWI